MFIIEVAPDNHVLAVIRTQGEEYSNEVFIVGVTVSNLDIDGSDIYITQASYVYVWCPPGIRSAPGLYLSATCAVSLLALLLAPHILPPPGTPPNTTTDRHTAKVLHEDKKILQA